MEPGWLSNSTIWSSIPAPKSPCFSPTPLVLSSLPAHLLLLLFLLLLGHLGSLVLPHQLRQVGHVLVRLLQQVGQPLVLLLVDQLAVPFLILSLGGEEEFSTPTPTGAWRGPPKALRSLTIKRRIRSFSILSFSFFCSRSVLAW